MSYKYNADEIFEMAEQIERNGAAFYKEAAEKIEVASQKQLLSSLAKMELEHENTFKSMRSGLTEKETKPITFDPEGEAGQYLKALADIQVFFRKKIDLQSIEEILKAAIVAEKDSIVFYLGMKDFIPELQGKGRIDVIIHEEMKHIEILSRELLNLKK